MSYIIKNETLSVRDNFDYDGYCYCTLENSKDKSYLLVSKFSTIEEAERMRENFIEKCPDLVIEELT